MKLEFEEPKMELIILDEKDVITTSGFECSRARTDVSLQSIEEDGSDFFD